MMKLLDTEQKMIDDLNKILEEIQYVILSIIGDLSGESYTDAQLDALRIVSKIRVLAEANIEQIMTRNMTEGYNLVMSINNMMKQLKPENLPQFDQLNRLFCGAFFRKWPIESGFKNF